MSFMAEKKIVMITKLVHKQNFKKKQFNEIFLKKKNKFAFFTRKKKRKNAFGTRVRSENVKV